MKPIFNNILFTLTQEFLSDGKISPDGSFEMDSYLLDNRKK